MALVIAEYLSLDIQDPGSLLLERIELLASVTWRPVHCLDGNP
jgi:hypothetical protein